MAPCLCGGVPVTARVPTVGYLLSHTEQGHHPHPPISNVGFTLSRYCENAVSAVFLHLSLQISYHHIHQAEWMKRATVFDVSSEDGLNLLRL